MGTEVHPSQKEVYICKVSDQILSVDLEESTKQQVKTTVVLELSCPV